MESPQPFSDAKVTRNQVKEGHASDVGYPSLLRNVPNEVLSHIFVLFSCDSVLLSYTQADDVPRQVVISQVCSKWRQVALSIGGLWSNIRTFDEDIIEHYVHYLSLYQAWIGRAGAHPLTITIDLASNRLDEEVIFQDFVLPFQIKRLDITVMCENLVRLSKFPTLNVEEFAISLVAVGSTEIENFAAPPFMNRTRSISLHDDENHGSEWSQVMIKELCLPWHQLSFLDCDSPLSALLSVLPQAQSLEQCRLTIYKADSAPMARISMPSLRRLSLNFAGMDVKPDIIVPLFATPNLTALGIRSWHRWSSDTYDIIKKHYKLHQLQEFQLCPVNFPLRIVQVLVDAPMVHKLHVEGKPVVDAEALEGIASGRLGRYLSSLYLGGCFDDAGEWFDMIEARQRHVDAMVTQVSNWRQMITGLKMVEFRDVKNSRDYKERVAALKALGTNCYIV